MTTDDAPTAEEIRRRLRRIAASTKALRDTEEQLTTDRNKLFLQGRNLHNLRVADLAEDAEVSIVTVYEATKQTKEPQ